MERETFIIEMFQINGKRMSKRVWSVYIRGWDNSLLVKRNGKFEIVKQVL